MPLTPGCPVHLSASGRSAQKWHGEVAPQPSALSQRARPPAGTHGGDMGTVSQGDTPITQDTVWTSRGDPDAACRGPGRLPLRNRREPAPGGTGREFGRRGGGGHGKGWTLPWAMALGAAPVCNLLTDPIFVQLPPERKCHEHGSLPPGQSPPRLKCCAQRYLLHGSSSETHCGTNWTAGPVTPARPGPASHRQRALCPVEARTRPAGPRHRGSTLRAPRSALPRAPAGAASGAGPGAAEFSRHQPRVCRPRPPVALGQ